MSWCNFHCSTSKELVISLPCCDCLANRPTSPSASRSHCSNGALCSCAIRTLGDRSSAKTTSSATCLSKTLVPARWHVSPARPSGWRECESVRECRRIVDNFCTASTAPQEQRRCTAGRPGVRCPSSTSSDERGCAARRAAR